MTEQFVKVNGIKICYEIGGEGQPVVLVHGFGVKKEAWRCQFPVLSKMFQVIRFDNRGAGKSDRPNKPYSMELFADDIAGLMDALDISNAHIIGWSLGGMICQEFALKYPEKINKLILINTLPQWPARDEKGIQMYINSKISSYNKRLDDPEEAFFSSAKMSFTRNFIKEMKADPNKKFHDCFSANDLIEDSTINPSTPQDIKNQAVALKNFDVLEKLNNIKLPTMILAAAKDKQTPKIMNEKIHEKMPNSKFIVIEASGHRSPMESAPRINKEMFDFLRME